MPDYLISTRWRRWLVVFSAILLVGLLVGLVSAYRAPDMLEQETSLLEYQHRGEFDYEVYLKPSYLYGTPQQDLPPNQKFPAAIVDSIDFTFHYSPVADAPAEVWIDAVLQNPGIWQKAIELVPPTGIASDSDVSFSLDVDAINAVFDIVEGEIGITSTSRNVDISAFVGTAEEYSVYTLAIKLGATLIEVDNNLRIDQASGTGEFSYVVNLKPNSIYDTETIASPQSPATSSVTILGPGDIIFPQLVDKIDITFDYSFGSDKSIEPIATDLEIMVVLKAGDIWAKEFLLFEASESGDFNVKFSLDLPYYLDMLKNIASETGVPAESHTLTVSARVHATADTPFGKIDDTFSHLMLGALEVGTLQWEGELAKTENGAITISQVVPNPQKILGLSVPGARVIFSILTTLSFFLGIYSVIFYFRAGSRGLSQIEQEVFQIRKQYGDRIVEATSQATLKGERVISLDSIENLFNTADELGKIVIHQPPISQEGPHAYYLFDGITRYQHLLGPGYTEESFEVIKTEEDFEVIKTEQGEDSGDRFTP